MSLWVWVYIYIYESWSWRQNCFISCVTFRSSVEHFKTLLKDFWNTIKDIDIVLFIILNDMIYDVIWYDINRITNHSLSYHIISSSKANELFWVLMLRRRSTKKNSFFSSKSPTSGDAADVYIYIYIYISGRKGKKKEMVYKRRRDVDDGIETFADFSC